MTHQRSDALDLAMGAVAGAIGVWVMDRVGWSMYRREDPTAFQREHEARSERRDVAHAAVKKAADLTGAPLPTREPSGAGIAVHYALGILPGALYAAARRKYPALTAGHGTLYGFGLFVLMDEITAPALGLASGPAKYPWQAHARGLVSHLVLGIVTETVLGAFRRIR
ncbi:DUF1440 domain-containing protein [Arthrobacter subterraneus]|nr:DUF1440 domain-containing protein [Arthrobacter subterraneus]